MEIDHLSASRVNMFLKCAQQYFYRYCEGLVAPPSAAMTRGSSYHRGVHANMSQKIESHEDMPVDDVLDHYSTDFDVRSHDTLWQDSEDKGEIKDSGIVLLREYQEIVAPDIQPVASEQEFELALENKPWTFTGILDIKDDAEVIHENKTSSQSLKQPRQEHLIQITGYSIGAWESEVVGKQARLTYAVSKKQPEIVSHDVTMSQSGVLYFLTIIAQVANAIESEIWTLNRSHNLCSKRWCAYFSRCIGQFGGTVKD